MALDDVQDEKDTFVVKKEIFGLSFRAGDVIGCGWSKKDNCIFFVREGRIIGQASLSSRVILSVKKYSILLHC